MGKITVKHFLNTKIKPKEIEDKQFYPVYINIIYNKFTTDKKCASEILATNAGYDNYVNNGEWIKGEYKKKNHIGWGLNKELHIIDCAIKVIDDWCIPVNRKSILPLVEEFSHYASKTIINYYYDNIAVQHMMMTDKEFIDDYIGEEDKIRYFEFLLSFAKGNVLGNMSIIKNYTGIDLKGFLNEETIVDMEAIDLITQIEHDEVKKYGEEFYKYDNDWVLTFGEFIYCGYEDKIKAMLAEKSLSYYQSIIDAIKKLINKTIEYNVMFHGIE